MAKYSENNTELNCQFISKNWILAKSSESPFEHFQLIQNIKSLFDQDHCGIPQFAINGKA